MGKKKSKPMSPALKSFLKKHGRFPRKGELSRSRGRSRKGKRSKSHKFVFTKARRAALRKAQRASHGHRGRRFGFVRGSDCL